MKVALTHLLITDSVIKSITERYNFKEGKVQDTGKF